MQAQAELSKLFFVLHDRNFHKNNRGQFRQLPQLLGFLKVVQVPELTLLDYIFLLREDERRSQKKVQFRPNFQQQIWRRFWNFQDFLQCK